jgi:hypothetical protein
MSELIAYHLEDGIATLPWSVRLMKRWTRPRRIARW